MAAIGNTALTYADWAKRMDDGYKVAAIIELLSQTNEILDDMLVVQGNLPTGHKTTVRSGLPQATWRLLNYGIVPMAPATCSGPNKCCNSIALIRPWRRAWRVLWRPPWRSLWHRVRH